MRDLHLLFFQPEVNIWTGIAFVTQLLVLVENINGHDR